MKLAAATLLMLSAAASAQTPGEPYRALGTEPFWALTIDGRTMRLDEPDAPPLTVSAPAPRPSFNGRRYVAGRMMVDITSAELFELTFYLSPASILTTFIVALLAVAAVSALPGLIAARIRPIQVLRYE